MQFSNFGTRSVIAAFDGGEITTDAGLLLLRERATQIKLFERMAACFVDRRDPARIKFPLPTLLAQRICGIATGHEDIVDHDTLRFDPVWKLLAAPDATKPVAWAAPAALAGKSTLNRMEQSWQTSERRYCQIMPNLKQLNNLYTELFMDSHEAPPERIILDIDATDIQAHGDQEGSFFHGYYLHQCFLPLYIFCGHHLLLAQLRPSDIDAAQGGRNVVKRIVKIIRARWPDVKILLRGDSGFVRENLIEYCEARRIDYIFGLARNDYLLKKAQKIRSRAAMELLNTSKTVKTFGHFHHMPKSRTWNRPRQVIAKVLHRPGQQQRCRFLVTSLDWDNDWVIPELKKQDNPGKDTLPRVIYETIYCPRGDMENRIKDCQLDLFGDRMSAHAYQTNQLRLILAGFAYVLIDSIRREALQGTKLAKAVPNTIRLKLLKVGAKVNTSVRRIKISMPDAHPYKDLFFKAWQALSAPDARVVRVAALHPI